MAKKSKKRNVAVKQERKTAQDKNPASGVADEEKRFDFGGLPERDLKKNLGCG